LFFKTFRHVEGGMLENYFKTTFKKCVTNVEPKSEHVVIGEKLIADDSSSSSTLRGERRKKFTVYINLQNPGKF
jgi:hypothetical protein